MQANQATTNTKPTSKPTLKGEQYRHRNETVFVPTGYFAIGRISTAHGLRGEVRVELHTDFPERFAPDVVVYVGRDLLETVVEYARPHKQQLLIKLAGVENRNQAEALRSQWLFVAEADTVELTDDTYWVHDIIGMQVQTDVNEPLGTVREVLFTGANDVYVIELAEAINGQTELLLPAIAEVVQAVDLEASMMTVHLLPGILD